MQKSPSCKGDICSSVKETSCPSWDPHVYYHLHKSLPLPAECSPDLRTFLFNIHFNTIPTIDTWDFIYSILYPAVYMLKLFCLVTSLHNIVFSPCVINELLQLSILRHWCYLQITCFNCNNHRPVLTTFHIHTSDCTVHRKSGLSYLYCKASANNTIIHIR
jgi:hypothetical protein